MATNSYNDISTANSVKLLNTFTVYNDYIMLYTEIDSHIETGDRVYITIIGDIGDISEESIILDNIYSSNVYSLYNDILQGYTVLYVDKTKNAVVINKNIKDISVSDDMSGFTIENQYISKISIHNITIDKCNINGATIKKGIINNSKIDGNVNWIQGNIFGGEIYNTVLDNKYDNSYITLKKPNATSYVFTANNTEMGDSDGYSYFYNMIIQDSIITNGNFKDCELQNTKEISNNDYYINGGVFDNCNYVKYKINNGYHKNIINLDKCVWNNGYFDCPETGYSFDLPYWYNGVFMKGLFGGVSGQKCNYPIWVNGIFNNGVFDSYKWENGEFNNGIFGASGKLGNKSSSTYDAFESHLGITKRRADGNLFEPLYPDNNYEYITFVNGIINGGFFVRTKFINVTVGNGTIADSIILNINNLGGLLIDCTIKKGELSGGYIRSNFLSSIINNSVISNTDINFFDTNDKMLKSYKSDSAIVGNYIDAYSLYSNLYKQIYINKCSLLSPILRIENSKTDRVFINRQNYINGGIYENINFISPQIINGGEFKNCEIKYKNNNGYIPNSVFCSVRPVRVFSDNLGTSSKIYTMLEYSNTDGYSPFLGINGANVTISGFFYTKLSKNATGNNNLFDSSNINIIDENNNYDPKNYDNTKYKNINSNTDTYIILDIEYKDYMFGDFGIMYLYYNGNYNNIQHIINGGIFEECKLAGIGTNNILINGGVFDNSDFNGFVKIESCNFNGGVISGNSNEWNGGNFNSGTFSKQANSNNDYTLKLMSGANAYFSTNDNTITTLKNTASLTKIYPLIIRREYAENNIFDNIGKLHDKEFQEYYLDIWNSSGIDFTTISNEAPWSDNIINTEKYLLVPSHFVFIIKCESSTDFQDILSFINKKVGIDILDVSKKEAYNVLYNKYFENNGNNIPVNDFRTEYINYYINKNTYSIALVFKFTKIEELYNNMLNKNQSWFNNIFKDYNLYYKNIWSEANAGYFVRPMPVYDSRDVVSYSTLNKKTNYGSYPTVTFNGYFNPDNLPAPWHFDNDGKIWLPLHQGGIYAHYKDFYDNIIEYKNNYIKNTNEIFPQTYYEFKKNNKCSFNTSLPYTKTLKTDYITDSIEINSNITNYVNINSIGNKVLLKIDADKLNIYKGGWEDYYDLPFNFKISNISDVDQSWVYIDQSYGIDGVLLGSLKINPTSHDFIHIVSHDEKFNIDYDGPCRIIDYSNVMGNSMLYRIKIDKKILNNYGHGFIVNSKHFTLDYKTITIYDLDTINFKITTGSILYIYTPSYKGKVTITTNGVIIGTGTGTRLVVVIAEIITVDINYNNNFIYGLDSWDIDTANTPDDTPATRVDLNVDNKHYSGGFNGVFVPSNEKNSIWGVGDNLWVSGEPLSAITSLPISQYPNGYYPNGYVQGKIVKIKTIKENYDGMYLYDTIFNYTTDTGAGKVNVYLCDDNTTVPNFEKSWVKDTTTINVIGNSIDFDNGFTLLPGFKKLSGTVIRYNKILSFKKTTNIYTLDADITDTDYSRNIINMANNKDFIEIHNTSNIGILSGVYESKTNISLTLESYTKKSFTISSNDGYSAYSIRTLPIYYTESTIQKERGNYVEFGKLLNNSILPPAFNNITTNGTGYNINITCDKRDTFYGKILNISKYTNPKVSLIVKHNNTHKRYEGIIQSVTDINNNYNIVIKLNGLKTDLEKVEYGYFYIIEEVVAGSCYKYYTTNDSGLEITENDTYHYNSGDPSKPIKSSPKHILRELNENVRTTEDLFERQAGLIIKSKYNLSTSELLLSDKFNDGNFYSGEFYGDWYNGDWFANNTSFNGNNYYNRNYGLDFTLAPERKEASMKNFTDIINSLIKRGEYFMYPPWTNKERQIVVTPKITRSDEY